MDIIKLHLELITCENERSLQLLEIYSQIRNLKPIYLTVFEKYDRVTPCIEYCEILKLFVLYYIHIYEIYELVKGKKLKDDIVFTDNEEFRTICCSILMDNIPISSDKLHLFITYLNRMLSAYQTFDNVEKDCSEIYDGNTVYIPGCYLVKIGDIVKGIISDTKYSYIYFEDCFTKYKSHGGILATSYSDHDIDHHIVVNTLIERNLEIYKNIKELYNLYFPKQGTFVFRCLEVVIFMYYHEMLPHFDGYDILSGSFIYEEIVNGEVGDVQQLFKYMIKASDVDLDFRAYILDRFDNSITEYGDIYDKDNQTERFLTEEEKYIYLSDPIVLWKGFQGKTRNYFLY